MVMKNITIFISFVVAAALYMLLARPEVNMSDKRLTAEEEQVIVQKGTDRSGKPRIITRRTASYPTAMSTAKYSKKRFGKR